MATQMPAGFVPVGHHGGGKNATGAYWYPTKAHARAHADHADHHARQWESFLAENLNHPAPHGEIPAMKAKAAALRREATDAEKHADSMPDTTLAQDHADFDDHVDGALKAATERYVTAAREHGKALATREKANEAADAELEEAGGALTAAQDKANELAPYSDMEQDTHTEWGSASIDDENPFGVEHPEAHAAHNFLMTAREHAASGLDPEHADDKDLASNLTAFRAHVHGPLNAATERYHAARAKHAAAVVAAATAAEATRRAHHGAADHLAAQQQVAQRLSWGFPNEVGADEMSDHDHSGGHEYEDEPDEDDIKRASAFLATAQKVKAKAHEMTRAKGIDMDTLVNGPDEEEDEPDEDEDEPKETMTKSYVALKATHRLLRALLKGKRQYPPDPRGAKEPGWEPVERPRALSKAKSLPPAAVPHQDMHADHNRALARAFVVAAKAGARGSYQPHHDDAVSRVLRLHQDASHAHTRVVSSLRSGSAQRSPARHARLLQRATALTSAARAAEQHPHYLEALSMAQRKDEAPLAKADAPAAPRGERMNDEVPMSKAQRALRSEWRALRQLLKGVKKGTKKKVSLRDRARLPHQNEFEGR